MGYTSGRNKNRIKNRFNEANRHKQSLSIGAYIERMDERKQCPARIVDGKMEILLHGHYVSPEEFNECLPEPIVISFDRDSTNVDKTRAYLL